MFTTIRLLTINALAVVVIVLLAIGLIGFHEPPAVVLYMAIGAFFVAAWLCRADDLIASKHEFRPIIVAVVGLSFLLFLLALINDVVEFADGDLMTRTVMRTVFLLVFLAIFAHGVAAFVHHIRARKSMRNQR